MNSYFSIGFMKHFFCKFILIFALVLTSINLCFPNEVECSDASGTIQKTSQEKTQDRGQDRGEEHHCICSMTCHNLFLSFVIYESVEPHFSHSEVVFTYIPMTYPQVYLSLDKPPIV